MDWTEINIEISADQVDEAAAIAQMVVPYGIYIEDYSDLRTEAPKIAHIDLIDEELLQKDVTKALIHIYISPDDNPAEAIAFLREKYTAAGIANSISTTAVKQEEWATAWKQYYHPQKLGNRLVVCPSWEERLDRGGFLFFTHSAAKRRVPRCFTQRSSSALPAAVTTAKMARYTAALSALPHRKYSPPSAMA